MIKMLECFIDNVFGMFGGRVFQQTVSIPIGTICTHLPAYLFLSWYEVYFTSLTR